MKITILNGNPRAGILDAYLAQLGSTLTASGHAVTQLDLRDIALHHCIGCWGCWVKTPGQCSSHDASIEMDRAVINADFVLWAAPLKMGFPGELLKMALDKHLPLIHPYMEVAYGEAHHLKRYAHYPRVGLLLEKEATTDDGDLQIVRDIHCRTAINFKSRLEFSLTTETPVAEIAKRIAHHKSAPLPLPQRLAATVGAAIQPPARLTLFNGSPRGSKGNTPIMLGEIAKGFEKPDLGKSVETYHLIRMKETEQMAQAFAGAECAILGFPLYTDSMPGTVKHFIEALEPFVGRPGNPPLGFLVQSGFPEGLHSRYVERYLEKLAARLGSPYLGTVVKGNGEGTRIMPPEMNRNLFNNLQSLGAGLAAGNPFGPKTLRAIAKPEAFPVIFGPVFKVFLRLPIAHGYFDDMLKRNGVYEQRFARPFVD
ncbi:MAG: NAD(P)H-dependent oxidoreductase [Chloroflexota bacterium]